MQPNTPIIDETFRFVGPSLAPPNRGTMAELMVLPEDGVALAHFTVRSTID